MSSLLAVFFSFMTSYEHNRHANILSLDVSASGDYICELTIIFSSVDFIGYSLCNYALIFFNFVLCFKPWFLDDGS